ncbi:hypothetical protein TELCIR_21152, partial [Teladorsagia circumcincta]
MFLSNPTVSQVSFLISDEGMDFPVVTLCNFNPIKKSYIQYLNATGEFSDELLDYLMQSLIDTQTLYSNADRAELHGRNKFIHALGISRMGVGVANNKGRGQTSITEVIEHYRFIKRSIQTSPSTVSLKKR